MSDRADRIVDALKEHPELLREVRRKLQEDSSPDLNRNVSVWYVQCVEHEFGQRDDGWSLFYDHDSAFEYAKGQGTPGRREQYWSYEDPKPIAATMEVALLILKHKRLCGKGNRPPSVRNPVSGKWEKVSPITIEHVYVPEDK